MTSYPLSHGAPWWRCGYWPTCANAKYRIQIYHWMFRRTDLTDLTYMNTCIATRPHPICHILLHPSVHSALDTIVPIRFDPEQRTKYVGPPYVWSNSIEYVAKAENDSNDRSQWHPNRPEIHLTCTKMITIHNNFVHWWHFIQWLCSFSNLDWSRSIRVKQSMFIIKSDLLRHIRKKSDSAMPICAARRQHSLFTIWRCSAQMRTRWPCPLWPEKSARSFSPDWINLVWHI